MKWNRHIENIVKRTKYLVYVSYKLSGIVNTKTMLLIYYAYFHGVINYGIQVWGSSSVSILYPLQNLQNKLIHIINKKLCKIENYPLRLDQVYALESLVTHYQEMKSDYMNSKSITRYKSLNIPKFNKTIVKNSSKMVAIRYFNLLPKNLKSLSTCTKNIKYKLKDWIIKNT